MHSRVDRSLQISHATKQREYLRWKTGRLNRILGCQNPIRDYETSLNGKRHEVSRWWSEASSELYPLWKELYPCGRKHITPGFLREIGLDGLALLYMDDGSLHLRKRGHSTRTGEPYVRERTVEIALYLPHDTCVMVGDWIEGLTGALLAPREPMRAKSPDRWNLRASGMQARQFVDALRPYACKAMDYKFDLRYDTRTNRGKACWSEAERSLNKAAEADKVTRARSTQTELIAAVGDEIV
jgi:hypothetical protein